MYFGPKPCSIDKLILVDIYLLGYPPKSKTVINAITKFRKKISQKIYKDKIRSQQESVLIFKKFIRYKKDS